MEQYHHCHGYHTLGNQTYHPSFHPLQYPSHQQSKANCIKACKQFRSILSTAGALCLNQLQLLYISLMEASSCNIRAIITPYNRST